MAILAVKLATPPPNTLFLFIKIFSSSYDLRTAKKSTVRARLRAGGERPSGELATPRPWDGLWGFCLSSDGRPLVGRAADRGTVG